MSGILADITGIGSLFEFGGKLLDRFFPDPAQRDQAKLELLKMQQEGELATLAAESNVILSQLAVNKAEAEHASVFVAGWRPAIGWVCACAVAYNFLLYPLLSWLTAFNPNIHMPPLFANNLFELIFGMLGLGTLRTIEKIRGASK